MERIIVDKWNQNSKKLRKYYYSQIPQKVNKFHLHGKTFSEWFDYIVESLIKNVLNTGDNSLEMKILSKVVTSDDIGFGYTSRYFLQDGDMNLWMIQDFFGTIDVVQKIPLPQKKYYINFAMYCSLMYVQQFRKIHNDRQRGPAIIDIKRASSFKSDRLQAERLLDNIKLEELLMVMEALPPESREDFKLLFTRPNMGEITSNINLESDFIQMDAISCSSPSGTDILSYLMKHFKEGYLVFLELEQEGLTYPLAWIVDKEYYHIWGKIVNGLTDYTLKRNQVVIYGSTLDEIYKKMQDLSPSTTKDHA